MRRSEIERKTAETDISLALNLDGTGKSNVDTGCGFLNHMLTLFARHGRFDLDVTCHGDVDVDDHHSVEDIGICLGMAFAEALGNGAGIRRYGHIILPMDETLILCAVDLSGRAHLEYGLEISHCFCAEGKYDIACETAFRQKQPSHHRRHIQSPCQNAGTGGFH